MIKALKIPKKYILNNKPGGSNSQQSSSRSSTPLDRKEEISIEDKIDLEHDNLQINVKDKEAPS